MKVNLKRKAEAKMKLLGWDYSDLANAYSKVIGETTYPYRVRQIIKAKRPAVFQIVILNKIFRVGPEYWKLGKATTALVLAEKETLEVAKMMKQTIGNASRVVQLIDSKGGFAVSTKNLYRFAIATGKPMEWFLE